MMIALREFEWSYRRISAILVVDWLEITPSRV